MRYPDFLKENGTIGFIAPSFGCTTEPYISRFENALRFFHQQGFNTVLGPNVYKNDGIGKSTNPRDCGKEINEFFASDACDIIISCGGGETMCEDLPYIDFDWIRSKPAKWYLGFSDNTNLTFTLPTICDTAAIYGPCASSFGQRSLHKSVKDCLSLVKGETLKTQNYDAWDSCQTEETDPLAGYNCTEPYRQSIFEGKTPVPATKLEGRLIGGCMDILLLLCGTQFDRVDSFCNRYANDGIIWFMEACTLSSVDVERVLWKFRYSGWFKNTKGFLFGRPMQYNDVSFGLDQHQAILNAIGDLNLPIITDMDFGHLPPMMPILSGAYAKVDAAHNSVTIEYLLK